MYITKPTRAREYVLYIIHMRVHASLLRKYIVTRVRVLSASAEIKRLYDRRRKLRLIGGVNNLRSSGSSGS